MGNTSNRETTSFLGLIKPQKTEYFDIADQNTNAEILDEALKQHSDKLEIHSDRLKNLETGAVSEVQTTRDYVSALPESTLSGGSVDIKTLKGLTLVQQQSDSFENMWDANILLDSTLVYKNSSVGVIDNQSGTAEKTAASYKRTVLSNGDIIFMGVFAKCETGTATVNILSIGLDKNDNQIDTVQSDVEEITDAWQFYGTVGQHTGETLTCAVQRLKVASFGTENDKVYFSRPYYINLTAIGLEDLTYSQLAYMVQAADYWEGMQSVENLSIRSRCENLFDMHTFASKLRQDDMFIDNELVLSGNHIDTDVMTIPVKPESKIYISYEVLSDGNVDACISIGGAQLSEADTTASGGLYCYKAHTTWTKLTDTFYMAANQALTLGVWIGNGTGTAKFRNVQMSYSPIEAYTVYKDSGSNFTGTLRSLPNGVCDDVETAAINGIQKVRKVKNIHSEVILDGSRPWMYKDESIDGYTRVYLKNDYFSDALDTTDSGNVQSILVDHAGAFIPKASTNISAPSHDLYSKDLYINIPKTLTGWSGSVTTSAIQEFFKDCPHTLIYQLEKPEFEPWQDCAPRSFENGDIVLTSESGLLPEIQYTTPINDRAVLNSIKEKVSEHQSVIEALTGVKAPAKALTSSQPTVSLEVSNHGVSPLIKGAGATVTNLLGGYGSFKYESDNNGIADRWEEDENLQGGATQFKKGTQSITSTATDTSTDRYLGMLVSDVVQEGHYYFARCNVECGPEGKGEIKLFKENRSKEISGDDGKTFLGVKGQCPSDINYQYVRIENKSDMGKVSTVSFSQYMLVEISKYEYNNLDIDTLLEKYPYVEGTQNVSDIAVEIRGENLFDLQDYVPSAHAYTTFSIEGTKLCFDEVKETGGVFALSWKIPVRKGQTYTLSWEHIEGSWGMFFIYDGGTNVYNTELRGKTLGFSAMEAEKLTFIPQENYIWIGAYLASTHTVNTPVTVDQIMLVEGKKPLNKYVKPFRTRTYLDEDAPFSELDTFDIENGQAQICRRVQSVALDGTYNWGKTLGDESKYLWSKEGYKVVQYIVSDELGGDYQLTRPDGNPIRFVASSMNQSPPNIYSVAIDDEKGFRIAIPNALTGWADEYTPSVEEIKAYFNGWVLRSKDNGGLYNGTGQKIWIKRYQGIGTPFVTTFGTVTEDGTDITDICPKTKAYGAITESYTLRYELETPITYTVDLTGIPILPDEKSSVTMLSGIRKEKVVPMQSIEGDFYGINYVGLTDKIPNCPLDKKVSDLKGIYKVVTKADMGEQILNDTENWLSNTTYAYGAKRWFCYSDQFDPHAEYFVVYETLSEENNTGLLSAQLTYEDDAQSVVNALGKALIHTEEELERAKAQIVELTEVTIQEPTLLSGWLNYGETYGPVKVTETNDTVELSGTIKSGIIGEPIFKLDYVPKIDRTFPVGTDQGYGQLTIYADGQVKLISGGTALVSLDGIRFRKE